MDIRDKLRDFFGMKEIQPPDMEETKKEKKQSLIRQLLNKYQGIEINEKGVLSDIKKHNKALENSRKQ